jgi:hypothetical protein
MPWRCTSESSQLATLRHVLNSIYSHAVASHLTASSAQTQPYVERYDLDIWPQMVELSKYVLLTGYHRHTLAGIHQRHGHNKQRRRLRFMSNMLRTCIRVYLLCRLRHLHRRLTQHLLVWDMVIRRRAELFRVLAHCHLRQHLRHNFGGQEASHKLCRMFMGVNMGVMINIQCAFCW